MNSSHIAFAPKATRFIVQGPNARRYAPRKAGDEWQNHKAVLCRWHEEGVYRHEMVRRLAVQHGFYVKTSQLNSQMARWGLNRYRKSSHQNLPAFNQRCDDDSLQRAEMAVDSFGDRVEEDDVHMQDFDVAEGTILVEEGQPVQASEEEVSSASHSRTPMNDAQVSNTVLQDLYIDFGPELVLWPSSSLRDSSTIWVDVSQRATEEVQPAPPTAGDDVWARQEEPVVYNPTRSSLDTIRVDSIPPTCNPAQLKESRFLYLPYHSYPSKALQLFHDIRKRSRLGVISTHDIYRLNRVAAFLHALKAYELAFDIYLLILRYHNDANPSANCPSPQLVIAVINCMRCAQTSYQRYLAREAWKPTLEWLQTQDEDVLDSPSATSRYLRKLNEDFGTNSHLSDPRHNEDIVHCAVIDMVLGRNTPFDARIWEPRHFIAHWRGFVLEHLCECSTTRASVLDALKYSIRYLNANAEHIDSVLTSHWTGADKAISVHVARILACMLLHDDSSQSSIATPAAALESPHRAGGFPCTLNGLAFLVLPFVLTERIRQTLNEVPTTTSSILQRATRARPSRLLSFAATELHSVVISSSAAYADFLRLYLQSAAGDGCEKQLGIDIAPADWVFDMSVAAAGLGPLPDRSWSANGTAGFGTVESATASLAELSKEQELCNQHEPERSSSPSDPTSERSSTSTDYRLFRGLSQRLKHSTTPFGKNKQSTSSDAVSMRSSHSSWSLTRLINFPGLSSLPSVRDSIMST